MKESAPDRGQPGQHPRANFVRLCVGAIAFEEVITAAANGDTAVAQMANVEAGLIVALLSFRGRCAKNKYRACR